LTAARLVDLAYRFAGNGAYPLRRPVNRESGPVASTWWYVRMTWISKEGAACAVAADAVVVPASKAAAATSVTVGFLTMFPDS